MNRRFLSSLLGVGVACLLGAGAALPETVLSAELKKSFSYFANGHELRTVLTGFAKTQGLSVAFDGDADRCGEGKGERALSARRSERLPIRHE